MRVRSAADGLRLGGVIGAALIAVACIAGARGMAQAASDASPAQTQVQGTPAEASPHGAATGVTASAMASISVSTGTSTIQGVVKASGVPLPGVAVTAVSGDGKKYATTTDINGAFRMDVPAGTYEVRTELMGFASVSKQVTATAADAAVAQLLEFSTDLASRAAEPASPSGNAPVPAAAGTPTSGGAPSTAKAAGASTGPGPGSASGTTTAANRAPGPGARRPGGYGNGAGGARRTVTNQARGTQALDVQGGDDQNLTDATAGAASADVTAPGLAGLGGDDASATESIAVNGQQGQINGLAMFSEGDLQGRIRDMQAQGFGNGDVANALMGAMQTGTFGGPGGGPGAGGGFGGPGGGPGGFGGPGGGGGFGGGGGRGGGGGGRGGGGGFGGFGGPGGFRGQNPNAWHGTVGYNGFNNAINATPFSVTGIPIPKPDRSQNSLTASFTGTPFIPHLMAANPKQFLFISASETRSNNPTTSQFLVPTLAQRYGDLTPAYQVGTPLGGTAANPNTNVVYDPATGKPFGNTGCLPALLAIDPNPTACIPASELNTANALAAQALLAYYPLPNISATGTQDNFQANFPGSSHQSQISARFNRSFGQQQRGRGFGGGGFGGGRFGGGGPGGQNRPDVKPTLSQSISENFAYSHSASASTNFVPQLAGHSTSEGYSFSSGYTIGYGRFNNSLTAGWNRSTSLTSNYFTNLPGNAATVNPALKAGICVGNTTICTNPFYFGVPGISVTGGFSGLNNTSPVNSVNQTISLSENARWRRGRHNMQFGLDFRRIHADSFGTGGDLGSFTFSGFATQNPLLQSCNPSTDAQGCTEYAGSGSSMADFLIGLPQNSNITAGLNKIYLRGNSWDWFAQDDWRARSNLTFTFGMRWEYFSPYSEKYNRLVNLNVTQQGGNLAVSTVCGTAPPAGTPPGVCAAIQPGALVHPDKNLYSPRISVAWSPRFKFTKNTVVRSSYGINYNTGQYSRFATDLAFQQPFMVTQKNVQSSNGTSTGCTLANMTLTNGFGCDAQVTQSSFAVDPNYRLGMVQVYNLGIQKTLPQGVVLNIDYTGSYAGNLDMLRAPNRTAKGLINTAVGQFTYEDSLGYLRSNALLVNVRNRMHKGIALGATYKYSHSIDDASSVGGSGNSIAQNDQDLGAEESNSSFDQRHDLSGNFVLEPPVGPNRAFLNKGGFWSHALDGFNISGNFNFGTGGFATPTYALTAQEIALGAPSSLRPNRNYGTPIAGQGSLLHWFNTAAFTAPAFGTYGTATRNSIQLPGTVSVSSSLSRTLSFGETRSLEMRLNVSNVFNTVQYSGVDTQVNDTRFGQVTGAAGMRAFTYNLRYRF